MRLSARAHLFILMGFSFVALVAIVVLLMSLRLLEARSRAFGDAEIYAASLSKNLEHFHDHLVKEAQHLGSTPQAQNALQLAATGKTQMDCSNWLKELIMGRPEFTNLLIYNAQGQVVCSAKPATSGYQPPLQQASFLQMEPSIETKVDVDRTHTSLLYAAGAPILDAHGLVHGMIVFEMPAQAKEAVFSEPLNAHGGALYVVDRDGRVISSSYAQKERPLFGVGSFVPDDLKLLMGLSPSLALNSEPVGALNAVQGVDTLKMPDQVHSNPQAFPTSSFSLPDGSFAASVHLPTSGWTVVASLPSDRVYQPLRNSIYWQTALIILFAALAFFVSKRISTRISSAALTLAEAASHPEKISQLKSTGVSEIDRSLAHIQFAHYANEQAQFERSLWQSASQQSLSGLAIVRRLDNDDFEVVICNDSFHKLCGAASHEAPMSLKALPPDSALSHPLFWPELIAGLHHHGSFVREIHGVDYDGRSRHLSLSLQPLFESSFSESSNPLAKLFLDQASLAKSIAAAIDSPMHALKGRLFTLSLDDLTEITEREAALTRHSTTDMLTGLPNRALFGDRLSQAIEESASSQTKVAVAFLDLSRFKLINDTLGHQAGDFVIAQTAARLSSRMRSGDTLGRLGGDEFGILLNRLNGSLDEAGSLIENLSQALKEPFFYKGQEVSMDCCIGVAVYPDDALVASQLMQRADIALLRSKENARPGAQFFSHDFGVAAEERLHMEIALKGALRRGEINIHYQPKISLTTGEVVGMEALARWNHPQLGFVSPAKFIPVAEESELITLLGREALHVALRDCKMLMNHGFEQVPVAVNISSRQIRPGFLEEIEQALLATDLPASMLQAEITESLILPNSDVAGDFLDRLTAMGVQVALDDFGTGWSNLSMLKQLPLSYLKMDRSFVDGLGQDEESEAIAVAIIALAKAMGLEVIAEGIETADQSRRLKQLGVHQAQGFYVQPALPIHELLAWLQAGAPLAQPKSDALTALKASAELPSDASSFPLALRPAAL